MDTKRFELTDEEVGNLEWIETPSGNYAADFSFIDDYSKEVKVILQAQVAKVLSMLEPVELEALGDEKIYQNCSMGWTLKKHVEQASQRTIQHNQKGQLYRIREAG